MPERWLRIKGNPVVRGQLFQQQRVESLFDTHIDRVHGIFQALLTRKGLCHTGIRYSSSQLTSWFTRGPFRYEKFVREKIPDNGFIDRLPDADDTGRTSLIDARGIACILRKFRRLRLTRETIHLCHGAIKLINAMIDMTCSCDATHRDRPPDLLRPTGLVDR